MPWHDEQPDWYRLKPCARRAGESGNERVGSPGPGGSGDLVAALNSGAVPPGTFGAGVCPEELGAAMPITETAPRTTASVRRSTAGTRERRVSQRMMMPLIPRHPRR